ncbi:hypothetical protein TCON_2564, partial [Astathelohania contejeani]
MQIELSEYEKLWFLSFLNILSFSKSQVGKHEIFEIIGDHLYLFSFSQDSKFLYRLIEIVSELFNELIITKRRIKEIKSDHINNSFKIKIEEALLNIDNKYSDNYNIYYIGVSDDYHLHQLKLLIITSIFYYTSYSRVSIEYLNPKLLTRYILGLLHSSINKS